MCCSVCCYKQQHSKLIAQFVFKVSASHFFTISSLPDFCYQQLADQVCPSGGPGGRAPGGGPFAHPAEAANLSYFQFTCSTLHVQAWTDFLARNDVVISRYCTPRVCGLSVCLGETSIVTLGPHGAN